MNCKAASRIVLAIALCCSSTLWSQSRSSDNGRLLTLPPGASVQVSAQSGARGASSETFKVPAQAKRPIILNFDRLPSTDWLLNDCNGEGTGRVSHGILTLDSPSDCYEYILFSPEGIWNKFVDNSRGWVVETSLKIDPITQPECDDRGAVQIWANDHTILLIVGFSTGEVCIAYPDSVHFPMNTADSFHIYRIEAKGMHVRIYVDGDLAIDHTLSFPGAGTEALEFGDGVSGNTSLTRWDYFSYRVFP
jgi:hypothetical protein